MARLEIDFCKPARPRVISISLLLLASAAVVHILLQRNGLLEAIAHEQEASAQMDRQLDSRNTTHSLPHMAPNEAKEAVALQRALKAPWEIMLDDLQRVATNEILLSQVQPGAGGKVLVSGRADSSQAFTAFIKRLRQQQGWREAAPVSEVLGVPDITGKPLIFQFVAEYASHE